MVWFWGAATLFSLMAAWGRFSFLYALIYQLPGVSSIRNPIKFMHPFVIAWVILAGFGLEAFYRCYLQARPNQPRPAKCSNPIAWRRKLTLFDKLTSSACFWPRPGIFVGFQDYAGSKPDLAQVPHRTRVSTTELAARIAAFSIDEARWFVFLFALSAGVVLSVVALVWARRWTWAPWAVLCGIMIFDLSRADLPWVRYFNYDQKYSMNEVTKVLMDKPYEHRVVGRLSPRGGYDLPGNGNFAAVIHWWIENDFPYHDIQSLEIDQMPRMPVIEGNYLGLFYPRAPEDFAPAERLWKLTNTRYLLADASFLDGLNNAAGPGRRPFHYVFRFNLVPKPGITNAEDVQDAGDLTTQVSDQGREALIEYTDTLPRAKLYSRWLTTTNDEGTLLKLVNPEWDPAQSVIVSAPTNGVPFRPPRPPPTPTPAPCRSPITPPKTSSSKPAPRPLPSSFTTTAPPPRGMSGWMTSRPIFFTATTSCAAFSFRRATTPLSSSTFRRLFPFASPWPPGSAAFCSSLMCSGPAPPPSPPPSQPETRAS